MKNRLLLIASTISCIMDYGYAQVDNTYQKKQLNLPISWEPTYGELEITPLISLRQNSITKNDLPFSFYSAELGIGLTTGYLNEWDALFIPLGADWAFVTPYISGEYSLVNKTGSDLLDDPKSIHNGPCMNFGVHGAAGALVVLIPISIHGNIAYSTNFSNSAIKYGLGFDLRRYSINVGSYAYLGTQPSYKNQGFIELTALIWDKGYWK